MKWKVLCATLCGIFSPTAWADQLELEVDPSPYFVDGFSVHLAQRMEDGKHRAQLGIFAADVPEWIHGNDNFDLRVRAATVKLDHFFSRDTEGFFVGVDSILARLEYSLAATGEGEHKDQLWVGPRAGYRVHIGEQLYVTPWVSVMYRTNSGNVRIAGQKFDDEEVIVLPTVHVGWRF